MTDVDPELIEALREPDPELANNVLERVRHEPARDRVEYVYETMNAIADELENDD